MGALRKGTSKSCTSNKNYLRIEIINHWLHLFDAISGVFHQLCRLLELKGECFSDLLFLHIT